MLSCLDLPQYQVGIIVNDGTTFYVYRGDDGPEARMCFFRAGGALRRHKFTNPLILAHGLEVVQCYQYRDQYQMPAKNRAALLQQLT
jgi:hypothetical protein